MWNILGMVAPWTSNNYKLRNARVQCFGGYISIWKLFDEFHEPSIDCYMKTSSIVSYGYSVHSAETVCAILVQKI